MEINRLKKDETPYVIFTCFKCHQYLYVKTSQKTKKCLGCGYNHKVKSLINLGEIQKGLSNAIEAVKKKQNELAIKELKREPDLRTMNDFCLTKTSELIVNSSKKLKKSEKKIDYSENFRSLLVKLSKMYEKFPSYMISMLIDDYKIPISELKILTNKFRREGFLIALKNDYYKINNK